ncbi:MAG TPA: KH domain-containing protein [Candidatus Coprovivens excrementavium]|nr:KH domain-containing protein [Candidatus Coprovivens excrementavium]
MKLEVFEGKTKEEAKAKALESLKITEEEAYIKEEEIKGKLFKATTYKCSVIKYSDIADFIKNKLNELLNNMNLEVKFETNVRNEQINIKMYSDNNNILIGRNGQTLMAIQTILRQIVHNEIGIYPYILLDVENYKEKKISQLERNAKKIAHEVQKTKIDVSLDNMNSYERRIIHNALANFKNISTLSEGEEPNRHIVIRYKEDE